MTRSEALWIAPDEDLLAQTQPQPVGRLTVLGQWLDNRRLELAYLGAFLAANAIIFGATLLASHAGHPVSQAMQLGRACGACLSLDGALILLPVMRRTLTWLRSTRLGRVVPVDYAQDFHRLLGHALFGLALAHAVAFCASYASGHASAPMSQLLLHTRRGSTGALLLLVLLTIWAFALALVRRSSRFETFYFSHRLYWVWFALAAVHAPEFLPWVGLPFGAWCVEQVSRLRRRGRDTQITATHALRSGVSRLEIARPAGFTHRPGDYVFLCVPAIAKHEWHPFTLSNAPENSTLCIHVRSLGNWSAALREWVEHRRAAEMTDPVAVQIDGPYGSPSTHIFESRHAVLIGAGIGVTPFASVLESIVLRASLLDQRPTELRKVHFFWLNRDQYSFEWFAALLAELETMDHRDLLEVHICMTGGRGGATAAGLEVAREILHEAGQRDLVTGLRAMTHMGHPDWKSTLASFAERHAPDPVDVYFCGPKGLGRKLRRICMELGMGYREEKF